MNYELTPEQLEEIRTTHNLSPEQLEIIRVNHRKLGLQHNLIKAQIRTATKMMQAEEEK